MTSNSRLRPMNRRAFLDRVGKAAFLLTFSGVLWATRTSEVARATGTCPSPCGPSPICIADYCDYVGDYCKSSAGSLARRYGKSYCSSDNNKWVENYCNEVGCVFAGKTVTCADCCAPTGAGGDCTGSSCSDKKKCICRKSFAC
jgi:hypothetical protein